MRLSPVASDIPYIAACPFRISLLEQNVACLLQIVVPIAARRIVYGYRKISFCCSSESPLDELPRSQKVRQADHAEVVIQRRSKNCRSARSRSDPRDHAYIRQHRCSLILCVIFLAQLEHKGRHPVDSGVSAAYHGDLFAHRRLLKAHPAALYLLLHRSRQIFFPRESVPEQLQVHRIPDNNVRSVECRQSLLCHHRFFSRSHSDYCDHTYRLFLFPDLSAHYLISSSAVCFISNYIYGSALFGYRDRHPVLRLLVYDQLRAASRSKHRRPLSHAVHSDRLLYEFR